MRPRSARRRDTLACADQPSLHAAGDAHEDALLRRDDPEQRLLCGGGHDAARDVDVPAWYLRWLAQRHAMNRPAGVEEHHELVRPEGDSGRRIDRGVIDRAIVLVEDHVAFLGEYLAAGLRRAELKLSTARVVIGEPEVEETGEQLGVVIGVRAARAALDMGVVVREA